MTLPIFSASMNSGVARSTSYQPEGGDHTQYNCISAGSAKFHHYDVFMQNDGSSHSFRSELVDLFVSKGLSGC